MTTSATPGFVWPPAERRPLEEVILDSPLTPAPASSAWSRWRGAVVGAALELERWWLRPLAEPVAREAAFLGWARDAPGLYCERCGGGLGAFEGDEYGCAACRDRPIPWARVVRLGEYERPLSGWIHQLKFSRWRARGAELGGLLAEALIEAGAIEEAKLTEGLVVVPMATSRRRRLSRGVDHARCVARGVARGLDAPLRASLRTRHRPSQRALSAVERRQRLRGAFRVANPAALEGRFVILVDDVLTTGGTAIAAVRALTRGSRDAEKSSEGGKTGPAEVWVAVLAVTGER